MKKINDFVVFCLEIYKYQKNLTGKETYDLFSKYDLFKYLEDGYDMLHTQGEEWILNDIDEVLKIRGYKNK